MTRSAFIGLCLSAAVALAIAIFAIAQQPRTEALDAAGQRLLPDLVAKPTALKTIMVKTHDGTFTFDWNGQVWTFRERKGFPADSEKINALVVALTKMIKLEPKTALPQNYDRLDIADPTATAGQGKEVVLIGSDGKPVADVVVGKRKFSLGGKEGGTYVRVAGDPRVWLALGEVDVGAKPGDWMKRDIVDVKDQDIKNVTVTQPDGEKIVVGRQSPSDTSLKIENLPKGKQVASDYLADEYGRVLSALMLDDVAHDGEIAFPKDKTIAASFETFSGLHLGVDMIDDHGNAWIRLKADAAEGKTDAGKVAADINGRTGGWIFEVPTYQVEPLKKRMADLVKKPEKGAKT